MKIHRYKRCLLSKWNSFDQNFMKLCHIVKYHDVLKFDNGLYAGCPLVREKSGKFVFSSMSGKSQGIQ